MNEPMQAPSSSRHGLRRSGSAPLVAVLIGLALYLLLFFAAPLPSLAPWAGAGATPRRGVFVLDGLLLFDQVVWSWFGQPPEFALIDRLPVLAWRRPSWGWRWRSAG